jgi:hypothetical protein
MGGIYTFPGSREGRVNRAFEGRAGEKKSGAMASLGSFRSSQRSDWVVPSTFASVLGQVIRWPAEWCTGMEHVDTFMSAWESGGGSPLTCYSCPVYYQFEARGLCLFVHVRLECLRCELRPQPQTLSFYDISGSIPRGG